MGWTTAKGRNADYFLCFTVGYNFLGQSLALAGKADAIVGEIITEPHEQTLEAFEKHPFKSEHKKLFDATPKKDFWVLPTMITEESFGHPEWRRRVWSGGGLYFLTVAPFLHRFGFRQKIKRRDFLISVSSFLGATTLFPVPQFLLTHQKGELGRAREAVRKATVFAEENFFPLKSVKFLTALTAERIENCIAPILERELGRKPIILVNYGAAHSGLKESLENPEKRMKVLMHYRKAFSERQVDFGAFRLRRKGKKVVEYHKHKIKELGEKNNMGRASHHIPKGKISRREFLRVDRFKKAAKSRRIKRV